MLNPSFSALPSFAGAVKSTQILDSEVWLPSVCALHHAVLEALPSGKRHFLKPKTSSYFASLLAGEKGLLIGAFEGQDLVGMTALCYAPSFGEACHAGLVTYLDPVGEVAASCEEKKVGVVQSLCVLPGSGNGGLCPMLLQSAIFEAEKARVGVLFSQVAEDNFVGKKKFEEQGFNSVALWTNGHGRHLMKRKLFPSLALTPSSFGWHKSEGAVCSPT